MPITPSLIKADDSPTFTTEIPAMTNETPACGDYDNPVNQALLNNTAMLKMEIERLNARLQELNSYFLGLSRKTEAEIARNKYKLCDFYHFRRDDICEKDRRFVPAFGGLIENADVKYPEAWEYLKNYPNNGIEPLKLSEEDWQYWVGVFGGIGGGITYVQNLEAKTLRVPDLRGMFFEGTRLLDGQNIGNWHLDQMRPITGYFAAWKIRSWQQADGTVEGCVEQVRTAQHSYELGSDRADMTVFKINSAHLGFHYSGERTVPPAYFTLPTVFLGEYHGE